MFHLSIRCRFLYAFFFFLFLYPLPPFLFAILVITLSFAISPFNVYIKFIATAESGHQLKEPPEFRKVTAIEKETAEAEAKILPSNGARVEEDMEKEESAGSENEMIEEPVWNSPEYYNSRRVYSPSCSSFGSRRSEKDWRRTLACKLFEERHKAKGEEMDLLWEVYEMDSCSPLVESIYNSGMKKEDTVSEFSCEDGGERLCCLKAMKLSAEKMNMVRIGSSKLNKISKVLKSKKWKNPKKNS